MKNCEKNMYFASVCCLVFQGYQQPINTRPTYYQQSITKRQGSFYFLNDPCLVYNHFLIKPYIYIAISGNSRNISFRRVLHSLYMVREIQHGIICKPELILSYLLYIKTGEEPVSVGIYHRRISGSFYSFTESLNSIRPCLFVYAVCSGAFIGIHIFGILQSAFQGSFRQAD